jgi:predicted lipase
MMMRNKMSIKFKDLPRYIQEESHAAAMYARAAYNRDGYEIPKKYLIENKKTDTQVYVWKKGTTVWVAFRGTEKKLKDIITDLWCFRRRIPFDNKKGIRVHGGFLKAYMSIRDELLTKITEFVDQGAIWVKGVGHSLGGALTTLLAVDLQKNKFFKEDNSRFFTDGQPKVGNRKFAKSFNKRVPNYYRLTNKFDPVPKVPVTGTHVGARVKTISLKGHDASHYVDNTD